MQLDQTVTVQLLLDPASTPEQLATQVSGAGGVVRGTLLATLAQVIAFVKSGDWLQLGAGAILLFLSIQAGFQARQLREWFYNGIFDTILAYRLDLEGRVKATRPARK